MPYKDFERRRVRNKERRRENPKVHRGADAKYKRTLKGQFSYLKARAKRRGIQVKLTLEEFLKIREQLRCTYCHEELPQQIGHCLDRKDSELGYIASNVTVCCTSCNKVKSDVLTHEEMLVAMEAVLKVRQE